MMFDNPIGMPLDASSEESTYPIANPSGLSLALFTVGKRVRLAKPRWDTRSAIISFTFPALAQVSVSPPLENQAIWSISDLMAVDD